MPTINQSPAAPDGVTAEHPPSRTCANCAYWWKTTSTPPGAGECERIQEQHWGEIAGDLAREPRAWSKITEPGEHASIITGPEFGCVLHMVRA